MQIWPYLVPILLLQLGLQVHAVVHLVRRGRVRGGKALWFVVICLTGFIGPVIYWLAAAAEGE